MGLRDAVRLSEGSKKVRQCRSNVSNTHFHGKEDLVEHACMGEVSEAS